MSEDMIFPVSGTITTPFGNVVTSGVPRYHAAIDISPHSGYGSNIVASKNGTVTQTRTDSWDHYGDDWWNGDAAYGGYGNFIVISHNNSTFTRYCHIKPDGVLVKVGDVVHQGQIIGKVGSTGKSTGPHIHFEKYNGDMQPISRVNPLPLSPYKEVKELTEDEIRKIVKDSIESYNKDHYTESHQFLAWAQNVGRQPKLLERVQRSLNKLVRGFTPVYTDPPVNKDGTMGEDDTP